MSGDEPEQKRLFEIGYASGVRLVERIKNGTISEAERQGIPVGILLLLGGPTVDFVVGRIFENASWDAFDKVVKEDNHGTPVLDPSKWATGEVKTTRAENKFRASNCALIR